MRITSARGLVAAMSVALLTGCAGIPGHGRVQVGREISAAGGIDDVDVRVLPAAPQPDMAPADLVHGFLRAMVNGDAGYEIARSYLSRRAAAAWKPLAGVTTYDDSGVEISADSGESGRRTVQVTAPQVGLIDDRGDFTPRGGTIHSTFQLVRQNGQWRIDRLPDGVLLSVSDTLRSYRLADVYYLNRTGTTLVPEQVLVRLEPLGLTTSLVRTLLGGPGGWLRPAVHSAAPAGTALLGNVAVDAAGTAEVNLSAAVRHASQSQLAALSAQLVWTLNQVSGITAVRLLANGVPLAVGGRSVDQPRSAWPQFTPAAPPALTSAFYAHRLHWRRVPGARLAGAAGLAAIAVSHDGRRLAGVRPARRGAALVVGALGGRLTARLTTDTLTRPTFDRTGDVFAVATRGARRWVAEVTTTGRVRTAAAAALVDRPVQDLRMSRDGARVAAVVGPTGAGRLLVGRVVHGRDGVRFTGFRDVLPRVTDVRGVAWDGADQLVVTAADANSGRELVAVDVDGYNSHTVSAVGLIGAPVDVAKAPGQPLLVTAGGAVWIDASAGGWQRVGAGSRPAYAD